MTVCLYHGNCLDGVAAAWVVKNQIKGHVECIPCIYGKEPPYHRLEGHDVYIVDFSFPNDVMGKIESISKTMTLIDHHKTAEEQISSFIPKKETTEIVFDMNYSGASLTWQYFRPNEEPPLHILYVEDRDLWNFNLDGTEAYTSYLFAKGATVETYSASIMVSYEQAIAMGQLLVEDARNRARLTCKRAIKIPFQWEDKNYIIPMVNCPPDLASKVGNDLHLEHGVPFSITYHDNGDRRIFSLRGNGEVDVSAIARSKGGGGHHNAAGYSKEIEPVEI